MKNRQILGIIGIIIGTLIFVGCHFEDTIVEILNKTELVESHWEYEKEVNPIDDTVVHYAMSDYFTGMYAQDEVNIGVQCTPDGKGSGDYHLYINTNTHEVDDAYKLKVRIDSNPVMEVDIIEVGSNMGDPIIWFTPHDSADFFEKLYEGEKIYIEYHFGDPNFNDVSYLDYGVERTASLGGAYGRIVEETKKAMNDLAEQFNGVEVVEISLSGASYAIQKAFDNCE